MQQQGSTKQPIDRAALAKALEAAIDAKATLWDREHDLEQVLGFEVDGIGSWLEHYAVPLGPGDRSSVGDTEIDEFLEFAGADQETVDVQSGTCFECATPNPGDFGLWKEADHSHWYCKNCGSTHVDVRLPDGTVIEQRGLE